ncbi:hypothetical protein FKW77_000347 [Venturia effusa]|uniref:Uncharacterized protein n=1 Tax=Venturia effusa TaxID=50376 RepID=A0A517LD52_9PEZI|nr:hypothetical protein FKW77_000347 [Venturia effusa]
MPPIPVYANAPLHTKDSTPKTKAEAVDVQTEPTRTTTTVTSQLYQPSGPPPPQPGARPASPTGRMPSFCHPPGPQPDDAPHPYNQYHVTEIHIKTSTAYQQPAQPPSQASIQSPADNKAPTHSTASQIAMLSPSETGRANLLGEIIESSCGRRSLEHPPGYVQNPYAADGTAQDRMRFEQAQQEASEEEGVAGTVKNLLSGAGSALKKAEESAWGFAKGLGR